ncbi:Rrf2 family transcriptional regulator [Chitinophaga sp. XS-30]|uniref:RrF2 family transcriptional regulator n=1 Tax=Chitinophaga sp. XS-30 TaxID=2604421 RepID=UPI0011DC9B31|nr:Rrf2 family transcriptional regulator [Chitinophaga sp. XS-30]QEH42745.1 Rrf2 family transcriptional regulator [Chitinophaga sp. XS-30]
MGNVRFATAIHILTLLAYLKEEILSSEYIAGSININPVLVRKELSNLRQHGLVQSREGKGGGAMLAKSPKDILLADIYNAVRQAPLLGRSNTPNPDCAVGQQINKHIEQLYDKAEQTLVDQLGKTTLADFVQKF